MLVLRVFSRIAAALCDQLHSARFRRIQHDGSTFELFIQSVEADTTSRFIEKACQPLRGYEFER